MDEQTHDELRRAVDAQLAKADQNRIAGNEAFKAGDMKQALSQYYSTILLLKGFNKVIKAYPSTRPRPLVVGPSTAEEDEDAAGDVVENEGPSIKQDDEDEVVEVKTEGVERAARVVEDRESSPSTDAHRHWEGENEKVAELKKTMAQTYSNMAACHLKLENWKKALDFALKSRELNEDDSKATFREATARIKLGEVRRGRDMLVQMQAKADDVAIRNALKQLDLDDRDRTSKANSQFHGMFARNKDAPALIGSPAALSTASS